MSHLSTHWTLQTPRTTPSFTSSLRSALVGSQRQEERLVAHLRWLLSDLARLSHDTSIDVMNTRIHRTHVQGLAVTEQLERIHAARRNLLAALS